MKTEAGKYFTLVYGVLDIVAGKFRYVAAGHHGPIHFRSPEWTSVHNSTAVPIGIMEDSVFVEATIALRAGDRLYLHSDGFAEERNPAGEIFSLDRIQRVIRENRNGSLVESVDEMEHEVIA